MKADLESTQISLGHPQMFRKTGWLILCLSLSSCAGLENISISGYKPLENAFKGVKAANRIGTAALPISDEKEIQIGQVVAARVASRYGIYSDDALTKYISLVGQSLALRSGRVEIPYHFAILDSDEVNAFAAPGGYIFITKGILKKIQNEAQLAGVLAHEISHVAERHVVKAIRKANITAAVIKSGADYMAVGGELFEAVANKSTELVFRGLDRGDELESDRLGVEMSTRVGYAPKGLKEFLHVLKGHEKSRKMGVQDLLATHPKLGDRMIQLSEFMEGEGLSKKAGPLLADRFITRTVILDR